MLAALALTLAIHAQSDDAPRLRTLLPNGAVVLVENKPHATNLILQLAIADKNCPETPSTNGERHLMEHLMAKGQHRDIDRRLESHGAFLTAETNRDATVFTINLKPADLDLGLEAIADICTMGPESKDDIAKEAEIIREEVALTDDARKFSVAAWKAAYGDQGLDPMGDPDRIAQITPTELSDIHHTVFVGENVRLLIEGDLDLQDATKEARKVLELIPEASYKPIYRPKGVAGSATVAVTGEARGALVSGASQMGTAASLAAALAIASEVHGCFVTYTPTNENGLILVGKLGDEHDLDRFIDHAKPDQLFGLGRSLARQWVVDRESPSEGTVRALMLAGDAASKPEDILQNLSEMSVEDFRAGFAKFTAGNTVSVMGQ